MRIIGGAVKGRRLVGLKGLSIRPTSDKVREALFDILGDKITGSNFLDLYAGSGGVGLEALSRGADFAAFVEQNPAAIRIIKANVSRCGFERQTKIISASVRNALLKLSVSKVKFDIIFLDPPYESGLFPETLEQLADRQLLLPHSIIIAEHLSRSAHPVQFGDLMRYREKKYGQTGLSFYQLTKEANI
jgi:16S rRNA (guanine966-N2)-methyltransferase